MKKYYFLLFLLALPDNVAACLPEETVHHGLAQLLAPVRSMPHCILAIQVANRSACLEASIPQLTPEDPLEGSSLAHVNAQFYPCLAAFLKSRPLPEKFSEVLVLCRTDTQICASLQEKIKSGEIKGPLMCINGICIKDGDIHRVLNAVRLKNCLQKHNLDTHMGVAEKYFAHLKNDVWINLSQEIPDLPSPKFFNTEATQKFITLASTIGFLDWNYLKDDDTKNWHHVDGKLICIDTAYNSFERKVSSCLWELQLAWGEHFDTPEQDMIRQADILARQRKLTASLEQYDDDGNDFTAAAEEFFQLTQQEKSLS